MQDDRVLARLSSMKFIDRVPVNGVMSDAEIKNAAEAMVWGGDSLVEFALAQRPRGSGQVKSQSDETQIYKKDVRNLILHCTREDRPIDLLEVGMYASLTTRFLPMENISVREFVYVIARGTILIEFPVYMAPIHSSDMTTISARRTPIIEEFRAVVGDDSALMWLTALERRFGRYISRKAVTKKRAEWLPDMIRLASGQPYDVVAPYFDAGVWSRDDITDSLVHGVDPDVARIAVA